MHNGVVVCLHCSAGAPGSSNATFLNGMSFVEGWEQKLFISKWSMHQLVYISYLSAGFVLRICLSTVSAIYPYPSAMASGQSVDRLSVY